MSLPESALSEGFPWLLTINEIPIKAVAKGFEDTDVLLRISAERLEASAERLLQLPPLISGLPVEAEITHETGIYQMKLELLELSHEFGDAIMRLRLDEIINRVQRRQAFRMKLLANAKVIIPGTSKPYDALVRDLSETGIGLWARDLPAFTAVGTEVKVDFTAASFGAFVHDAVIRRFIMGAKTGSVEIEQEADDGNVTQALIEQMNFEVGAELLNIDNTESARIRNYLWKLQRERRDRGII